MCNILHVLHNMLYIACFAKCATYCIYLAENYKPGPQGPGPQGLKNPLGSKDLKPISDLYRYPKLSQISWISWVSCAKCSWN